MKHWPAQDAMPFDWRIFHVRIVDFHSKPGWTKLVVHIGTHHRSPAGTAPEHADLHMERAED